jgi:hypothetical protein
MEKVVFKLGRFMLYFSVESVHGYVFLGKSLLLFNLEERILAFDTGYLLTR